MIFKHILQLVSPLAGLHAYLYHRTPLQILIYNLFCYHITLLVSSTLYMVSSFIAKHVSVVHTSNSMVHGLLDAGSNGFWRAGDNTHVYLERPNSILCSKLTEGHFFCWWFFQKNMDPKCSKLFHWNPYGNGFLRTSLIFVNIFVSSQMFWLTFLQFNRTFRTLSNFIGSLDTSYILSWCLFNS